MKSLSWWANFSVSLLQWHHQSNDLLIFITLSISKSIHQLDHMQIMSLLQWHFSSMQWLIYSHHSIYQWIDLSTRLYATSESVTMTSSKLISSMSKSTSESVSMTQSSLITSKFMSLFLYWNLNSESATMMNNDWSFDWVNQWMKQALLCSRSESAVSLLQWHDHNWSLRWASRFSFSEFASMTLVNSQSLRWASRFLST